ncbi:hypothetical protein LTR37_018438 [Vermiconidia calcicola]|uniref:Uncharacterized protein n=1 Tax=Vermiconidia calcicola TaxID=1690605 RepID=A0ACC3MI71_9PEZI|nr:hypothetical protein LTR37_018438 [Vermiconidia calcicola]
MQGDTRSIRLKLADRTFVVYPLIAPEWIRTKFSGFDTWGGGKVTEPEHGALRMLQTMFASQSGSDQRVSFDGSSTATQISDASSWAELEEDQVKGGPVQSRLTVEILQAWLLSQIGDYVPVVECRIRCKSYPDLRMAFWGLLVTGSFGYHKLSYDVRGVTSSWERKISLCHIILTSPSLQLSASFTMAPATVGKCCVCTKETSQRCGKCSEGVDADGNESPTYYCSNECQKSDFGQHKTVCRYANARKQMYRGAALLQNVFYMFCRTMFVYSITDVEHKHDELHIHVPFFASAPGPLYAFPDNLVRTDDDRKAILTYGSCRNAVGYMHELAKHSFKGIAVCTKEWGVWIREERRKVVRRMADGSEDRRNYRHCVLLVTLVDGQEYVIDIAGAQHGQYNGVMPVSNYLADYASQVVAVNEFGAETTWFKELLEGQHNHTLPKAFDFNLPLMNVAVTLEMNGAVRRWVAEHHMSIAAMLNEKRLTFDTHMSALLANLKQKMESDVSHLERCVKKAETDPEFRAKMNYPEHMREFSNTRKWLSSEGRRSLKDGIGTNMKYAGSIPADPDGKVKPTPETIFMRFKD